MGLIAGKPAPTGGDEVGGGAAGIRAAQTLVAHGVRPVLLDEAARGSSPVAADRSAIANNTQPELAQKLAAFLLTPEAQAAALEDGDQIPSNPNTPTTEKTRGQVEAMKQYLTTAIAIDWNQVNEQRPAWNARWNRSIER